MMKSNKRLSLMAVCMFVMTASAQKSEITIQDRPATTSATIYQAPLHGGYIPAVERGSGNALQDIEQIAA